MSLSLNQKICVNVFILMVLEYIAIHSTFTELTLYEFYTFLLGLSNGLYFCVCVQTDEV